MTEDEAAEWMLKFVAEQGFLDQSTAATELAARGGAALADYNAEGYLCISKRVLKKFNTLAPDDIVYERGGKMWRKRQAWDVPGRQQ